MVSLQKLTANYGNGSFITIVDGDNTLTFLDEGIEHTKTYPSGDTAEGVMFMVQDQFGQEGELFASSKRLLSALASVADDMNGITVVITRSGEGFGTQYTAKKLKSTAQEKMF